MTNLIDDIIRVVASDFIVIPVVLATVVFFLLKTRELKVRFIAVLAVGGLLALIFARIGGALIEDPRPFVVAENSRNSQCDAIADKRDLSGGRENNFIQHVCWIKSTNPPLISHNSDNGFPSDHTLLSSLLGFAILPFAPVMGAITLIFALLIGIARVMSNVHHPLDIIGSFVFTGAAVLIAYYSTKIYFAKHLKSKTKSEEQDISTSEMDEIGKHSVSKKSKK